MKKILFPTDFSETADKAFYYAVQLAKDWNAQLLVLHSYGMPYIDAITASQSDLVNEMMNDHELGEFEDFNQQTIKLREQAQAWGTENIDLAFLFEKGPLVYVIEQLMQSHEIDVLIMGSTGASNLEKKIFGSNTLNVIQKIKKPIICIPSTASLSKINIVGFTTMLNLTDLKALDDILAFVSSIGAKLEVLHVVESKRKANDQALTAWTEQIDQNALGFFIEFNDHVQEGILTFIDEHAIDLLVMVRRNLNFFHRLFQKSITSELANHSQTALFILPEKE